MDQSHVKEKEVLPDPVNHFIAWCKKKNIYCFLQLSVPRPTRKPLAATGELPASCSWIKVDINCWAWTNPSSECVGSGPSSRAASSASSAPFPQVESKPVSFHLLQMLTGGRCWMNKARSKWWFFSVVASEGGGNFYRTKQGWIKVDIDHEGQSWGKWPALIHYLLCPIPFLYLRTVFWVGKQWWSKWNQKTKP